MGLATKAQASGLSIAVHKPIIDTSVPSYDPEGDLIDDSIGYRLNRYSHVTKAVGGYWSASFTVNDRLNRLEDWIDRLGYHVEVYSPALVKIWEGFISSVYPNVGGLSVERGPLTEIGNDVLTVFSTVDTSITPPAVGMRERTEARQNTNSQNRYGIIEKVLSVGGATAVTARQIRDTWRAENALPQTGQSFNSNSSNNDPGITIECLGYVWFLTLYVYNQTTITGTVGVSDAIQNVLAADPNGLFSTDYTSIDANALATKYYVNKDNTAWNYIKYLTSQGDASDNRWTFGIYNDRKARYATIPTDIEYLQYLADPKQRVLTVQGQEIKPWEVMPVKWLQFPDFLVGRTEPATLREDSRVAFLEQVQFQAPWSFSFQGGKTATLDQRLAQLGLGGVG